MTNIVLRICCWIIASALACAQTPDAVEFARHLHTIIASYPTDGTHTYHWPKSGSWAGVTRDLDYRGERIADGDPEGRCYCCGLTFEVFVRAWQRYAEAEQRPFVIAGVADAAAMKRLRGQWFGSDGNRRTMQNAIVEHAIGTAIAEFESAQPGDFVQFWRHNGSGHAVVFVGWLREGGRIVGLRYWSTQKSTNGIGEHTERFGGERGIDPEQIHIARVGRATDVVRIVCFDGSDVVSRGTDAAVPPPWEFLRDADIAHLRGLPAEFAAEAQAELQGHTRLHGSPATDAAMTFVRTRRFESSRSGALDVERATAGEPPPGTAARSTQWAIVREPKATSARRTELTIWSIELPPLDDSETANATIERLVADLRRTSRAPCIALGELAATNSARTVDLLQRAKLRRVPFDQGDPSAGAVILASSLEIVRGPDQPSAAAHAGLIRFDVRMP